MKNNILPWKSRLIEEDVGGPSLWIDHRHEIEDDIRSSDYSPQYKAAAIATIRAHWTSLSKVLGSLELMDRRITDFIPEKEQKIRYMWEGKEK